MLQCSLLFFIPGLNAKILFYSDLILLNGLCDVVFVGNNCELSTSYCESAEEVKGDPPACHNGGTCLPDENSFTCSCAAGFTGELLSNTSPVYIL